MDVDQTSSLSLKVDTLAKTSRRAKLLYAAARVSRSASSILDPDELLRRTVDIICDEYGFYYAGIFLIEDIEQKAWAVLKAGRGQAGQLMIDHHHKLEVGGHSMIGACTDLNQARIALDVGLEAVWFNNPFLPDTRSEMALPLAVGEEVIGALTVQSTEEAAFSAEDIASLQMMADQLALAIHNARLYRQNIDLFRQATRRAMLLQAGASVSQTITSILDLDELLQKTVEVICQEYGFSYTGLFLVEGDKKDEAGRQWAVLKADWGELRLNPPDREFKLEVGGGSMIGTAIKRSEARIALGVEGPEQSFFVSPFIPNTRSEMALPLIVKGTAIGALTVQSEAERAFAEDDISSLQIMADQLAVVINNARLLKDLEKANQELVRTKTFETIATATGETIHWVGNKAAPIPACVIRAREDLARFIYLAAESATFADEATKKQPLTQVMLETREQLQARMPHIPEAIERLRNKPLSILQTIFDIESVLEDLDIIEESANTILKIKEDLFGPARHQKLQAANICQVVKDNIKGFALPEEYVVYHFEEPIPPVKIDLTQMGRVLINLVKNGIEAMDDQPSPQLIITIRQANENFVTVDITDNGAGIAAEDMEKIWLTFHTNKAKKGGTGLGLPACLQSMERMGGRISVTSEVGTGSTFTLYIPIFDPNERGN
jgi:GAF domain-containing protein